MRGREINYTFWGEPIDDNWYEWYLAVRKLFEKYGYKITHYGIISDSYSPGKAVTANRKEKEIIRILESGEVPKCFECHSAPKDFITVIGDSHLSCIRSDKFISVFYLENQISSIDENDIMEMKKFIRFKSGEVFASRKYCTAVYSFSREQKTCDDFELIKTIED